MSARPKITFIFSERRLTAEFSAVTCLGITILRKNIQTRLLLLADYVMPRVVINARRLLRVGLHWRVPFI